MEIKKDLHTSNLILIFPTDIERERVFG